MQSYNLLTIWDTHSLVSPQQLQARSYSRKMLKFQSLLCFPTATSAIWYSQKRIIFAYFLIFPTATSAIWYSQKCQNCIHPVVFPTATSAIWYSQKLAVHLRSFCCFPHCYKRDLMLLDRHEFTHCCAFHTVSSAINFAFLISKSFTFQRSPQC